MNSRGKFFFSGLAFINKYAAKLSERDAQLLIGTHIRGRRFNDEDTGIVIDVEYRDGSIYVYGILFDYPCFTGLGLSWSILGGVVYDMNVMLVEESTDPRYCIHVIKPIPTLYNLIQLELGAHR